METNCLIIMTFCLAGTVQAETFSDSNIPDLMKTPTLVESLTKSQAGRSAQLSVPEVAKAQAVPSEKTKVDRLVASYPFYPSASIQQLAKQAADNKAREVGGWVQETSGSYDVYAAVEITADQAQVRLVAEYPFYCEGVESLAKSSAEKHARKLGGEAVRTSGSYQVWVYAPPQRSQWRLGSSTMRDAAKGPAEAFARKVGGVVRENSASYDVYVPVPKTR